MANKVKNIGSLAVILGIIFVILLLAYVNSQKEDSSLESALNDSLEVNISLENKSVELNVSAPIDNVNDTILNITSEVESNLTNSSLNLTQ